MIVICGEMVATLATINIAETLQNPQVANDLLDDVARACRIYLCALFLCFFQEKGLIVRQKGTKAILLEDKRWTEPKKYGKISIRNEALKLGVDGE